MAIVTATAPAGRGRWPWSLAISSIVAGVGAGLASPLYGATATVGLITVLLTVANPVVGLGALTLAVPLSPSSLSETLPVTPTDALAVIVLFSALATRFARRYLDLTVTGAFWPSLAFVVVLIASAAGAADALASAKEILRWIELLGMLVVTTSVCQRASDRRIVTLILLGGMTAEALLGWVQFLLRRGPDGFRIGSFLRAYGTFGQPNPFAGYLVMTLPIAFAAILWLWPCTENTRSRASIFLFQASLGGAGIGVIALLMSLSRGALLGLGVAGLVLVALFTKRGGVILAFLAVGALLVGFGAASSLLPATVTDRLAQIWEYVGWFDTARVVPTPQNWAIVERMAHWQAAWNMYFANPVLGVGPGHYAIAYPDYRVNDFWLDPLGHAHNLYLNVMAEEGFLGIVAYLAQFVAWLAIALAGFRRSLDPADRALTAGVIASLAGVATHNIFDNLTVHGLGIETGILLGLAAAVGRARPASTREAT